ECALLARDIAARAIEDIQIPEGDWDVLAQQLAAMAAAGPLPAARAYALLRRSYGYRSLSQRRFKGALQVLSGYYPFSKPLLDWDRSSADPEITPAAADASAAKLKATAAAGSPSTHNAADNIASGTLNPRRNTKMAAILGAG